MSEDFDYIPFKYDWHKNKNTLRFRSDIVCVSNLVRTWMTAVLLYTFSDIFTKT